MHLLLLWLYMRFKKRNSGSQLELHCSTWPVYFMIPGKGSQVEAIKFPHLFLCYTRAAAAAVAVAVHHSILPAHSASASISRFWLEEKIFTHHFPISLCCRGWWGLEPWRPILMFCLLQINISHQLWELDYICILLYSFIQLFISEFHLNYLMIRREKYILYSISYKYII